MPKRVRFLFLFLIISGVIVMSLYYIAEFLPNYSLMSPDEYYDASDEGSAHIVFGSERIVTDVEPILSDGKIYIPVDIVQSNIDEYIFWDGAILTVTTADKLIRMHPGETEYYINNESAHLDLPIIAEEGSAFMPAELLKELYGTEIKYEDEYNIVIADQPEKGGVIALIAGKRDVSMRYEPNKKSYVQKKLAVGDEVNVYDEDGDYTKIRTSKGLVGYVLTKEISVSEIIDPTPTVESVKPAADKKLNIVWDTVYTKAANSSERKRILHKGLDVLSPTWFKFDDVKLNGDIISLADHDYVKWAHQNGYQVWALIEDNYDAKVSNAVLSSTEVRQHVINQLLDFIAEYNLDGINVDYEKVQEADARYFLQFLRELAPLLKQRRVILSADMYVPTYTKHYNRTEVGKVVDYIMIMAYDEHASNSKVSGPVASIPFVERGITDTLLEVEKEKLILGLPYYVRIWIEETADGVTTLDTREVGMNYAYRIFDEQGVEFEWLDDVKSYYGEYSVEENDKTTVYKVWLEDLRSIEEKLKLAVKYDLAGVAGWRRDLESEGVWDLIYEYIN